MLRTRSYRELVSIYKKQILIVIIPLLLSPIPLIIGGHESQAGWMVLVMGLFWGLELLPLAGTALLPIVFFPLFGILSTDAVCREYFKATCTLFFGGLVVAIAVEESNLHRRIACKLLLSIGISPRMLMLGFMVSTAFLSAWISNTATTAMMVPILQSVLLELEADSNTRKMMFLAVAYAANCGGTGTLVGNGPNLLLYGALNEPCTDQPISFLSWMYFSIPILIVNLVLCWLWLQVLFIGLPCGSKKQGDKEQNTRVASILKSKQAELGNISMVEIIVSILFMVLVLLWFFRDPDFMKGWRYVSDVPIADATPVILICILLLGVPKENGEPFLKWQVVEKKLNWSVIFITGGGFALAAGMKSSGLNDWLGNQLTALKDWDQFFILIAIIFIVSVVTQVASNTACASMFIPVLLDLSISLKMNPLFLMLPATLTCSYAFVLPVSTGPNAIVFEASEMKTMDMVKAGLGLNFIVLLVTVGSTYTVMNGIFGVESYPDWAQTCESHPLNLTALH